MRLLHTSDWHLGRSFHGEDLLAAQASYVDHLIETVEAEQVDLVVVSGDVYDRALPSVDAVALADEAFHRLAPPGPAWSSPAATTTPGAVWASTAGSSTSRGCTCAPTPTGSDAPILVDDEHGTVAVYACPTSSRTSWRAVGAPGAVPPRRPGSRHGARPRRPHDQAGRAVRGRWRTRSWSAAWPATASATSPSEASRWCLSSCSTGIDYTALGHLHGRAVLSDTVRYSGSPIAYSFSEAHHVKGSWLVDLDASGVEAAEFVEAPVPRRLATLEGTLDDLLAAPAHAAAESAWVQATLTDPSRPTAAMDRLRARFPHVVALRFAPAGREPAPARVPTDGQERRTTSPSTSSATCVVARRPRPSPCCSARPWSAAPTTATWSATAVD